MRPAFPHRWLLNREQLALLMRAHGNPYASVHHERVHLDLEPLLPSDVFESEELMAKPPEGWRAVSQPSNIGKVVHTGPDCDPAYKPFSTSVASLTQAVVSTKSLLLSTRMS